MERIILLVTITAVLAGQAFANARLAGIDKSLDRIAEAQEVIASPPKE